MGTSRRPKVTKKKRIPASVRVAEEMYGRTAHAEKSNHGSLLRPPGKVRRVEE